MWTNGAGLGERQADGQANSRRSLVERMDFQRSVLLDDDDAGRVVLRRIYAVARLRALEAVDGQAWQPEAENPSPVL